MTQQYQRFRKADSDIIEEVGVRIASISARNGDSSYYVCLQDIQDVFPDAQRFKLDGHPILFLQDRDGNRIEPPRIAFYPDKVLDVITGVPQYSNSNSNIVLTLPFLEKSTNLTSQDLPLSLSNTAPPSFESSLTPHNIGQTEIFNSEKSIELPQKIDKQGDGTSGLQQMLQLQSEMLKVQFEMLKLQQETKKKDDEMLKLQYQSPYRCAILQKHVSAALAQNFELHEHPVPRLFIILPDDTDKWDPRNVLGKKFRLHFLCECGDHTASASDRNQSQIHITQHYGYGVRSSIEFFRKYGKYMVILLQWLKLEMPMTASLMPTSYLDAGINYSLDYMKALANEYSALKNINAVDDYVALELEGADLRQLGTFLQTKNGENKLGSLYRVTSETGHAKWVCFDHYLSMYRDEEQIAFEKAMELNGGGEYDLQIGKVTITLKSRTAAKEFYDALANVERIYELDITFRWNWTTADLEALREVLRGSSISILQLELGEFQESNIWKFFSSSTRYQILSRIIGLPILGAVHIILPPKSIEFSTLRLERSPNLHKLSIELRSRRIEPSELRVLVNALKTDTVLTTLDMRNSSIGNEGALALSEALKSNTNLTTLNLSSNSMGKEGAFALSEALMTNTTLTILHLSSNAIGEEGAHSLSEALKTNVTLTFLNLHYNSIGNGGALALSEALK
ncbi:hypothetical protein BX616_010922, partial [Lobosporangium transversale]